MSAENNYYVERYGRWLNLNNWWDFECALFDENQYGTNSLFETIFKKGPNDLRELAFKNYPTMFSGYNLVNNNGEFELVKKTGLKKEQEDGVLKSMSKKCECKDGVSLLVKNAVNSLANKKLIYSEKSGIVGFVFSDETKEIAHCSKDDTFDPYVGAALAIAYHMYGGRQHFRRHIDNLIKKQSKKSKN